MNSDPRKNERFSMDGYQWWLPPVVMFGLCILLLTGIWHNSVDDPYGDRYREDHDHRAHIETMIEEGFLVPDRGRRVKADREAYFAYFNRTYTLGLAYSFAETHLDRLLLHKGRPLPPSAGKMFRKGLDTLLKKGVLTVDERGSFHLNRTKYKKMALSYILGRQFLAAERKLDRFRVDGGGKIVYDVYYLRETNHYDVAPPIPRGRIFDAHRRLLAGWENGRRNYAEDIGGVYHVLGRPGRFGIEKRLESRLKGKRDRGLHELLGLVGNNRCGDDLKLSLDLELSRVIYELYTTEEGYQRRGAAVVLEVGSGQVLAAVSSPAPQLDMSMDILTGDPEKPLLNRAWNELFFPGSTYKVVVGAAMLAYPDVFDEKYGVISNPEKRIPDLERFLRIRNHGRKVHPRPIDLYTAMAISSNTYFARQGVTLRHRVKDMAEVFGFNRRQNLFTNLEGVKPWHTAETQAYGGGSFRFNRRGDDPLLAQFSIGQNNIKTHPMHMASLMQSIANKGTWVEPSLVVAIRPGRPIRGETEFRDFENLKASKSQRIYPKQLAGKLRKALWGTMNQKGGTGYEWPQIYRIQAADGKAYGSAVRGKFPAGARLVPAAGKTGTAQGGAGKPHAWFVGYAPAHEPKVVVAVMVENAGYGAVHAIPIASRAMAVALESLERVRAPRSIQIQAAPVP